jgi:hypothetical protein
MSEKEIDMATQLVDSQADAPIVADVVNDDAPPARDYEADARKQGWRPREEFPGDDGRWIDAETFVKRGEELTPFLKASNKILEAKLARVEKRLAAQDKVEQRAYDRAVADLKAKQEHAVELGDVEAHRAVSKELDELKAAPPEKDDAPDDVQAAVKAFADANPWYAQAGEARDYADFIANGKYAPLAKTMSPTEFFEFIAERTRATFPDLQDSEKPRARPRSMVEAPTNRGMSRGQKTFADLPAEAQRMADRFVKMGVVKDRATYVKDYQW